MQSLDKIPFFQGLADGNNFLIAGAGGGFDIFSGIPLYLNLRAQGKNVVLANFSFTWLSETTSNQVTDYCYEIKSTDHDLSRRNYFPEKYLKQWLGIHGLDTQVYAFDRTGVQPLRDAYKFLIKRHDIDTIILVDGGTDSLMFGDEEGLGTPQEDICSMAAVYRTGIKQQYLVSIGFGIDHFHGVSHYHFLENVAELIRDGGYLGLFQLTREMDECRKYFSAVDFANKYMPGKESIVSNSIASAAKGDYGDHHKTSRTQGSNLWINPLMSIYWCFDLRSVIGKNKYYEHIKNTKSMGELNGELSKFRGELTLLRNKQPLPL